jgi:hypothetical protein
MSNGVRVAVALCAVVVGMISFAGPTSAQEMNNQRCLSNGYKLKVRGQCGIGFNLDIGNGVTIVACSPYPMVAQRAYYQGGTCQGFNGVNCQAITAATQVLWESDWAACSPFYWNTSPVVPVMEGELCQPPKPTWTDSGRSAPATPACHDTLGVYIGDEEAPAPPGWGA